MNKKLQKTCFKSLEGLGIDWKKLVKEDNEIALKFKEYLDVKSKYIMVSIDYSQLELYVLAGISKDKFMIETVNSGKDLHAVNTEKIYHISKSEYEDCLRKAEESGDEEKIKYYKDCLLDFKTKRTNTKSLSFSLSYGASVEKVAMDLRISFTEAKKLIDDFYEIYPEVKKWQDDTLAFAIKNGYVETPFGRRRATPKIFERQDVYDAFIKEDKKTIKSLKQSREYWRLREEVKLCKNTPIQSIASDMCSMAAIKVRDFFRDSGLRARLYFWVHDSIVFSVHIDDAIKTIESVMDIMENKVKYKGDPINYRTSIEVGYNYEFCSEISREEFIKSKSLELIQSKLNESIDLDLNKKFKLVVKATSLTVDDSYVSNMKSNKEEYFKELIEKMNIPGVYTPEDYIAYQNNMSLEEYLASEEINIEEYDEE